MLSLRSFQFCINYVLKPLADAFTEGPLLYTIEERNLRLSIMVALYVADISQSEDLLRVKKAIKQPCSVICGKEKGKRCPRF